MKILFAIQGTGNGHLSRAREIIPILQTYGEVDLLVSGTQSDVKLQYPIKYKFYGLSYTFGKNGGVDVWSSIKSFRAGKLLRDIQSLPVHKYDVVFNDFEPISAWACKLRNKPCIALSHQAAFLSEKTPRPHKKDLFAEAVLKYYAPSSRFIGFHYEKYDSFIRTPVIRNEVRQLNPRDSGHITVYLPAYDDALLVKYFSKIPEVQWQVFTKHHAAGYNHANITVIPIENTSYLKSLETCHGLITGGGFEAPTEGIFLNKKIMILPMNGQYEQHCNAISAKKAGCTVLKGIDQNFVSPLRQWLEYSKPVHCHYPDETASIIGEIFDTL